MSPGCVQGSHPESHLRIGLETNKGALVKVKERTRLWSGNPKGMHTKSTALSGHFGVISVHFKIFTYHLMSPA